MPTYDYLCPKCGDECERIAVIANRNDQKCSQCGEQLDRIMKPQRHFKPFNPYFDMGLGVEVTSPGQRKAEMRKNGFDFKDHPSKGQTSARMDKIADKKRAQSKVAYRGTAYSR
jgi:putative FmdB family regulatory protein